MKDLTFESLDDILLESDAITTHFLGSICGTKGTTAMRA
jgi:hypothetical protein